MESQPTPSNGHCHNGWFIKLCDPSSLVCDALLENKTCSNTPCCALYCTASQTSLFSGTPMQSILLHSSNKPRSRSEDNRCISKVGGCTCPTENDPLSSAVSSCCSRSNFCFGTGLSSPISTPSPTGSSIESTDGVPKNNPPKSPKSSNHLINDRPVNSICDSSSTSPPLPPPMRIINLDRLSMKDSSPGKVRTALEFLSTDLTAPECPSIQCNPATMLQQCFLLNTGKHGSVSEYIVTTDLAERLRAESPNTPRLRPYNLLHTHETSARDSGLSSQSSNSTNLASTFRIDDRDSLGFSKCQPPPPVPPHAPHSRAAAAAKLAAQSSGAPAASGRTSPAVTSKDRVHGLTIRLSLNRRPRKALPMTTVSVMESNSDEPPLDSERKSNSPIWKRKHTVPHPVFGCQPEVPTTCHEAFGQPCNRRMSFSNGISSNPVATAVCSQCDLAKRYFLCIDIAQIDASPFDLSVLPEHRPTKCQTCKLLIRRVGANLFNRDPMRCLSFLKRHDALDNDWSKSIADYILSTDGLSRSRIGAFLGLPPSPPVVPFEVMQLLFDTLDFRDLEVDEALRLAIHHFGLPVESQEIDRFLECLAVRYHASRWPDCVQTAPPVSVNHILLLFYSILLLQTSLHNENAAKSSMGKQTVNQFVKNSQSFLFNEEDADYLSLSSTSVNSAVLDERKTTFSHAKLSAIFRRIKAEPLRPGVDHTHVVDEISRALTFPDELRVCKRNKLSAIMNVYSRLAKPHRRLVFHCVMIQFVRRPNHDVRVGLLRHVFLFNDVILLTRHARQGRLHSRTSLNRKRQQQRVRHELLSLLRGSDWLSPDCLNHLVHSYFPPLNRLLTAPKGQLSSETITDTTASRYPGDHPSSPVTCLPVGSASESRWTLRRYECGKLAGVRLIPLLGCVIKPFETEDCRFGMEVWRNEALLIEDFASGERDLTRTESVRDCWRLVATLAAVTQADYENILRDLLACLREVHWVDRELTKFN
ncbi:hypothetical protein P879_03723 [Paragonimus westermani]|uniref:SEC7 domain-containing protein n=1 Tax=Paragonimus westermani TaxID=34504 RepID=A0A8T0DS45_9TREM|nr:hypothetical protein P879_03723 [Paragonimus westermani]